jgi:hypothetical protein
MTPARYDASSLALALDAFLAEHRGCWRLYGEGLERGQHATVLWLECPTCAATRVVAKVVPDKV